MRETPAMLRGRLKALLAGTALPTTPRDLDLAEAVCMLRWPNWPGYQGCEDLWKVEDALRGLPPVGIDTLHRLAANPRWGPRGAVLQRLPLWAQAP